MNQPPPDEDRRLRQAVNTWAGQFLTAPRRFDELITGITNRDEVVRRLATHVVRRTIHERRAATQERRAAWRAGQVALAPDQIDPFAYTLDSLRAATETVGDCAACAGGGAIACQQCSGSGRKKCPVCWGSGKQRSEKTGKPINCKTCRTQGHIDCRDCSNGRVGCPTCGGNGKALIWLAFVEASHWKITLEPDGPVVAAHPSLRKEWGLEPRDLEGFHASQNLVAQGPLGPDHLRALGPDDRVFVEARGRLTTRTDRVVYQQFVRLEVPRRDVTYEMCGGTTGTVVLSGSQWLAATTDDATRPIRRRRVVWGLLMAVFLVATGAARFGLTGSSAYFDGVRSTLTLLWLGSVAALAPTLAGVLRRLPLRPLEKGGAIASAALLAATFLVGFLAKPGSGTVTDALAAKNSHAARLAFDALREIDPSAATTALEDDVLLLEVSKAAGADRYALLQQVIVHKGRRADEARALVLSERLAELRRALSAQRADYALNLAKNWYPDEAARPAEIKTAMADASDLAVQLCPHAPCRLAAQRASVQYAATPARTAALEATRRDLTAALVLPIGAVPPSQLAGRLQDLRKLAALAEETTKVVLPEDELGKRAGAVLTQATALRADVPLVGASKEVVAALAEGLFKDLQQAEETLWSAKLGDLDVFLSFDAAGRCRGIYAVASWHATSKWPMSEASAAALLSRAVGDAAKVRVPAGQATTTQRWSVSGVAVAARGMDGGIFELRIGAAEP